jgi:hypothetical protein
MVHAYKPSYSGDRSREYHGSNSAQANSSGDPISKTPNNKKWADRVAEVAGT